MSAAGWARYWVQVYMRQTCLTQICAFVPVYFFAVWVRSLVRYTLGGPRCCGRSDQRMDHGSGQWAQLRYVSNSGFEFVVLDWPRTRGCDDWHMCNYSLEVVNSAASAIWKHECVNLIYMASVLDVSDVAVALTKHSAVAYLRVDPRTWCLTI